METLTTTYLTGEPATCFLGAGYSPRIGIIPILLCSRFSYMWIIKHTHVIWTVIFLRVNPSIWWFGMITTWLSTACSTTSSSPWVAVHGEGGFLARHFYYESLKKWKWRSFLLGTISVILLCFHVYYSSFVLWRLLLKFWLPYQANCRKDQ